ncbi:hypothetical protein GX50_06586 [[Emmonsia] crescens]|uniref:Uncharacterized protein n=1 Tax=[Emmonsia] crescens TaxID=73230 RepID=A0A2B7Z2Q3_9EURO|nr:hypothetical protein GX50_06586 [Emmonsia crescens]
MSAKAFSRTFIDLVLFDILERCQEEFTARNLCLIGEHPLSAQSKSSQRVSRIADCVLGYEPPMPTLSRTIESISILVGSLGRLGHIIAYIAAAQQHRLSIMPLRIINIIYGMISDGVSWRFLRLGGKILRVSDIFNGTTDRGQRRVNLYIDRIVKAAIE